MYKTMLISQLNDNPHLSKDMLTRVKSSLYFNNLVDKPKVRDGSPTMFIHVGTECAMYFVKELHSIPSTRTVTSIAKQIRGRQRKEVGPELDTPGRKGKRKRGPHSKKSKGEPAAVASSSRLKVEHSFWIGKVQSIQKKYGSKVGRCRECIDLLDLPSAEAACKVKFNWFTPHGDSGLKYKYNHTDPQLIDLDSVISTVTLSMDVSRPGIFILDKDDNIMITTFFI